MRAMCVIRSSHDDLQKRQRSNQHPKFNAENNTPIESVFAVHSDNHSIPIELSSSHPHSHTILEHAHYPIREKVERRQNFVHLIQRLAACMCYKELMGGQTKAI